MFDYNALDTCSCWLVACCSEKVRAKHQGCSWPDWRW